MDGDNAAPRKHTPVLRAVVVYYYLIQLSMFSCTDTAHARLMKSGWANLFAIFFRTENSLSQFSPDSKNVLPLWSVFQRLVTNVQDHIHGKNRSNTLTIARHILVCYLILSISSLAHVLKAR